MSQITDYQAKYFAHELRRSYANDHGGKRAGLLFDAQVEQKLHQIDTANSHDPTEQLLLKKHARRREQMAEDADDEFGELKKKLRDGADKYLELIEQALEGVQQTENILTINWKIVG